MKSTVLVLGASGMAGHIVATELRAKGFTVFETSRSKDAELRFDAFDVASYPQFFESVRTDIRPNFIVNCIGILVDECKANPSKAVFVNTMLPKFLEIFFRETQTKIIHISTDCVFNGLRGRYQDFELPNETHPYGLTKAFGEINNSKDITLRTSIIGPELTSRMGANTGLLHWFLTQPKNSTVQGYSKCLWSGISTLELCDAILWAMREPNASGIKHISRHMPISKYNLLCIANIVFDRALNIIPNDAKKIDKSLVASKDVFCINHSYESMLRSLKAYMTLHANKYPY